MEATKNNVNTFFQNPEVSAEDQLAPLPMEITLTPTETPRISTETAETVNVSAEGEKEAERAENKPTATKVVQMVKTELAENKP